MNDQLGVVLGTEDSEPMNYWFAVAAGRRVQLDDIVTVHVRLPDRPEETVSFYGIVDQVRRRLEGVQFDADTELVASGHMPAHVSYAAHVRTTRIIPEHFLPPGPGDPVLAARDADLDRALFHDRMDRRLPAGVLRNGEPAYINLDFLDGTSGGHVNISGVSGVATKTSFALFLLYSLFEARTESGDHVLKSPDQARAIVFNVKGTDLFYLDKRNRKYAEKEKAWQDDNGTGDRGRYEILGLEPGTFRSLGLRAPPVPPHRLGGDLVTEPVRDALPAPYCWSLREFCSDRLLPFVLVGADPSEALGFLLENVTSQLQRISERQKNPWLEVDAWELPEEDEARPFGEHEGLDSPPGDGTRIETFAQLVDYIEYKLLLQPPAEGSDRPGDRRWHINQAEGTRYALIRRLRGAIQPISRLVRGDISASTLAKARLDVLDGNKQVTVIDIHSLPALAQMFTVGVVLQQVFERKTQGRAGQVFVVLDELNKYAPAEGKSPIKDVLLDIAERGRSLGVILIGAQQTASEVERRVVGNAAIRVTGRLDAAESERSEYRFLPGSVRSRTTILTPGTMVMHQPDVPTPVMISFPHNYWATKADEVDAEVTDDEFRELV